METTDSGDLKPEKMLRWTVTIDQDGDDLILPLPDDMLAAVGWGPGDVLKWEQGKDGTWTLRKKEPSDSEDS
jgi:hypothetical protein